jgi:hypothetical protein
MLASRISRRASPRWNSRTTLARRSSRRAISGRTIAKPDPNAFRRRTEKQGPLPEILILRNNNEAARGCKIPNFGIVSARQASVAYMKAAGKFFGECLAQLVGQILVEQQHGYSAGTTDSQRSRSAAKARQALMSSRVKSGNSSRISVSDMPEARYSSTSYTVIRSPRMQGFPLRLPGSIVTPFQLRNATRRHKMSNYSQKCARFAHAMCAFTMFALTAPRWRGLPVVG